MLARLLLEPSASGILCQSRFQRVRKIVSFASLVRTVNVKISVALFLGIDTFSTSKAANHG